jgi:ABC-type nitrate/sulfonate/bicarbonate transport system permease component
MAATHVLSAAPAPDERRRVLWLRVAIVVGVLAAWQALAMSGLLFRDVVPSLGAIARALAKLLASVDFHANLAVTLAEIAIALVVGGLAGVVVGLVLGANPFLSRAFEPFIYYLGPTPKIIFFPIMIMWFGVGSGSKIAMGALSCFFPIAISIAAGMRQIEPVLVRVGRSFRASAWQMTTRIYLPAMRQPILNGARLGLGIAIIGTLLAETKLSNRGLGYLIIQAYSLFDMPKMYALLIVIFVIAIGANALVGRLAGRRARRIVV